MKIFRFVKKSVFYRIKNFINFHKRKFVEGNSTELYFNEQQECKTRPQVINVNGDQPAFFPFSIKTNKCSGTCNLGLMFVIKNKSWNKNKCRCECKELFHKGVCNKGFIWNPRNCEYECDKACDVGEYLHYEN